MSSIRNILTLLLSICVNGYLFCQQVTFDNLTTYNGLSQNSVLSIAQDFRGFMWFGTAHGLNRYDGVSFKKYIADSSKENTLSNDYINSIVADSKKTLWIGTGRGLNKLNLETNEIEKIPVSGGDVGVSDRDVRYVYEDREGNIWVGTSNGLNLLTDRSKNIFIKFYADELQGIAGNFIKCIFEDSENSIWVGTSNGLTRIKRVNNSYEFKTFRHGKDDDGSISSNDVVAIEEDISHNIWVGTSYRGLNLFDKNNGTFSVVAMQGVKSSSVRMIKADMDGKLWIGLLEGVYVFDPVSRSGYLYNHNPLQSKSLSQNSVYSIFHDISGSTWVGTFYGGVNVAHPYSNLFTTWQYDGSKNSLSSDIVSAITEDDELNLWISTEGGGLNFVDKKTGKFSWYQYDPSNPHSIGSNKVKTVYKDPEGDIWAGTTSGGLNLFNPQTKNFTHFIYDPNNPSTQDAEVITLLEDSQKRFWVGTRHGLKLFKKINNTLIPDTTDIISGVLSIEYINKVIEDGDNNIWLGTWDGLYQLKKGQKKFNIINGVMPGRVVNCLYNDKQGNIWAGIAYSGVVKYTPATGKTTQYTIGSGVPGNQVLSILGDEQNNLWMATDIGLCRLNLTDSSLRTFSQADGITGGGNIKNSAYQSSDGKFYFGGQNGLTSFFPDKIKVDKQVAPLVFTSLRLNNNTTDVDEKDKLLTKDISLTDKIRFKDNQNIFTINYALLSYNRPENNNYEYMLKGLDKGWTITRNTFITYTCLPPGKYTLLVKGANSDGVWSQPVSLRIEILPPIWKTWEAYVVYSICLLLILFLITRYFFRRELKKIRLRSDS